MHTPVKWPRPLQAKHPAVATLDQSFFMYVTGNLTFMQMTDSHLWINVTVTQEKNGINMVRVLNTLGVPIYIIKNCKYSTSALTCLKQDQDRYPWRIATMEKTSTK